MTNKMYVYISENMDELWLSGIMALACPTKSGRSSFILKHNTDDFKNNACDLSSLVFGISGWIQAGFLFSVIFQS